MRKTVEIELPEQNIPMFNLNSGVIEDTTVDGCVISLRSELPKDSEGMPMEWVDHLKVGPFYILAEIKIKQEKVQ